LEGFQFCYSLRVRYSEIDGQKIVFNAHYMTYLDVAITEYFREIRSKVPDVCFDIALVKTTLEFKSSAFLDDILNIYCRTVRLGNSSFTVEFIIERDVDKSVVLQAETIYVSYDDQAHKAVPIPDKIRAAIRELERMQG